MAKRSQVAMLPDDILKELECRLYTSRFSKYQQHSEWLNKLGYEISKSAIHRYGKKLQKQLKENETMLRLSAMEQMLLQDFRSLQDDEKIIQASKTLSMLASGFNVIIRYEK